MDALKCMLDLLELLMGLVFEGCENFAVFELNSLLFKVGTECAVFLAKVALYLVKAMA